MEGFSGNIDWGDIALATDFYELAMAAAYYYSNYQPDYDTNKIKGIFEMFVRKLPRNRSYLVAAGLEQVLYFLVNLKFNEGPPKFLDLDFIPEAFPVSYSKQLEAKNREFEPQ